MEDFSIQRSCIQVIEFILILDLHQNHSNTKLVNHAFDQYSEIKHVCGQISNTQGINQRDNMADWPCEMYVNDNILEGCKYVYSTCIGFNMFSLFLFSVK